MPGRVEKMHKERLDTGAKPMTELRKLYLDLAAKCLTAAQRHREAGLPGGEKFVAGLLADADRYAKKAEAYA
jgi:hypothetical protein